MAGFSDAAEAALLALLFNGTAWANMADNAGTSPQTNIACALHTADPTDSGTQTSSEAAYASYARVNVARTTGGWTVSGTSPTSVSPVAQISFPASTGSGSTIINFSTGKTGGGATAIHMAGTVTPNIPVGASGITPILGTASTLTLD